MYIPSTYFSEKNTLGKKYMFMRSIVLKMSFPQLIKLYSRKVK